MNTNVTAVSHHIVSVTVPELSWCGVPLLPTGQPFRTLDQVALNGLFPSTKTVCKDCLTLCVNSLLKNIEADNDY